MICSKCEGTGKLRENHIDKDGNYVLHKSTCDKCNGMGKVTMKKYAFSFRMIKKICKHLDYGAWGYFCACPNSDNDECSEKTCPLLMAKEIK